MTEFHPHFVTDANGKRLSVLLPIVEYEAMLELLEDWQDREDARHLLARIEQGDEDLVPWEDVKASQGL